MRRDFSRIFSMRRRSRSILTSREVLFVEVAEARLVTLPPKSGGGRIQNETLTCALALYTLWIMKVTCRSTIQRFFQNPDLGFSSGRHDQLCYDLLHDRDLAGSQGGGGRSPTEKSFC